MLFEFRLAACGLLIGLSSLGHLAVGQASQAGPTSRRIKVSEVTASGLIAQKMALKYPDAARTAGIQGTVILKVVTSETGDVKEVETVSGDPLLAQAAIDAVKQWKYKPYTLDGSPVEMETQLSISFHLKSEQNAPPPLGTFREYTYSNEYFNFAYPLSRDWVRETDLMRKRVSEEGKSPGIYVLLAAVHVPQHTAPLEADSSFVLYAVPAPAGTGGCETRLERAADEFRQDKKAKEKGLVSDLNIVGLAFKRADFDFRENPSNRTFLCTQSRDYLLQWTIVGLSKTAIEGVISTLNSIRTAQLISSEARSNSLIPNLLPPGRNAPEIVRVRVAAGVSQGMVVKKVQPIYPDAAKRERIQGKVRVRAVINKTGDITDLEVIEGPIELVVSAVNAVRQWKYRPYVLNGEPVEVNTEITVIYQLSGG